MKHTRQIAGKWPPLIPITPIGIERAERIKLIDAKKLFQSASNFDFILFLVILMLLNENISIPISIRAGWTLSRLILIPCIDNNSVHYKMLC